MKLKSGCNNNDGCSRAYPLALGNRIGSDGTNGGTGERMEIQRVPALKMLNRGIFPRIEFRGAESSRGSMGMEFIIVRFRVVSELENNSPFENSCLLLFRFGIEFLYPNKG